MQLCVSFSFRALKFSIINIVVLLTILTLLKSVRGVGGVTPIETVGFRKPSQPGTIAQIGKNFGCESTTIQDMLSSPNLLLSPSTPFLSACTERNTQALPPGARRLPSTPRGKRGMPLLTHRFGNGW